MSNTFEGYGLGWRPDLPDIRDFTFDTTDVSVKLKSFGQKDSVKSMLKKGGINDAKKSPPFKAVQDLRSWCPPVEDQKSIGSCTANAGVALIEFFERKAFGNHTDASRLFLYKATRNLLGWTGDTGAYLRSTMAAMALFGAPPEKYWPYDISKYDVEPPAFCYAFGQSYQSLTYYRLDPPGTAKNVLLARIKMLIAAKLPQMFGFTVYNSISQAGSTGKIPYPAPGDKVSGGHAVVAVGFDDNMKIKNTKPGSTEYKGAILIRNSWGTGWGDNGYGWLPYEYVLKGLAVDWWSLLKNEWINTGQFGL